MVENKGIRLIKKQANRAFGKDIVLLYQENDNTFVWLEAPKWDCGWYWGFGYLETYTNNRHPENSNDIKSHSHVSSVLWNEKEKYASCFHDIQTLQGCVLTQQEDWIVVDLFKQFYKWREIADMLHTGNANVSGDAAANVIPPLYAERGQHPLYRLVTGVYLPRIMQAIMDRLHPDGKAPEIKSPWSDAEMRAMHNTRLADLV